MKNSGYASKLEMAVSLRNLAWVKALLAAGSDPNVKMRNSSLLIKALGGTLWGQRVSFPIAQALILAGADVNKRNSWSESPLMLAIQANHAATVDLLLAHGADTEVNPARWEQGILQVPHLPWLNGDDYKSMTDEQALEIYRNRLLICSYIHGKMIEKIAVRAC